MKGGLAVVSYDCKSLKVLNGCKVEGTYEFAGVSRKEQVVQMTSADELAANLPLSVAKLSAEMQRGKSIDLAIVMVGKRSATRSRSSRTSSWARATARPTSCGLRRWGRSRWRPVRRARSPRLPRCSAPPLAARAKQRAATSTRTQRRFVQGGVTLVSEPARSMSVGDSRRAAAGRGLPHTDEEGRPQEGKQGREEPLPGGLSVRRRALHEERGEGLPLRSQERVRLPTAMRQGARAVVSQLRAAARQRQNQRCCGPVPQEGVRGGRRRQLRRVRHVDLTGRSQEARRRRQKRKRASSTSRWAAI